MALTYENIATTTLGSSTATITFSSIPATYTDLRLVFKGNCVSASRYIIYRFNSDSGSNYGMTSMGGDGTGSGYSISRSSDTYLFTNNYSGASDTFPQLVTTDIFSYASSIFKTTLSEVSNDKNGSGTIDRTVGCWRSTSAITSITIYYGGALANIAAGATATLYGILAA